MCSTLPGYPQAFHSIVVVIYRCLRCSSPLYSVPECPKAEHSLNILNLNLHVHLVNGEEKIKEIPECHYLDQRTAGQC